ncbi:MAG: zf-HC2 domain-containing protein [Clostridia bacterium]|nr:zf-HC2 domain-containing protein [Clostridia bacterium]
MNCKKAGDLIIRCFDGNALENEVIELERHLKSCETCLEVYNNLADIFVDYQSLEEIEPPRGFEINVMDKVNSFELGRKRMADAFLAAVYSACVAGVMLMIMQTSASFKNLTLGSMIENAGVFIDSVIGILLSFYKIFMVLGNVTDVINTVYQMFIVAFGIWSAVWVFFQYRHLCWAKINV